MKARDIMHWNPSVVTPDEAVSHAAEYMRYENDACIPVVEDATTRVLVGIITARDLATRCMARGHRPACSVGEHMTPVPLHTAHLEDDLRPLLHRMHNHEVRRLPVVSEDGILMGVISEAAIIEALATEEFHNRLSASMMEGLARNRLIPS